MTAQWTPGPWVWNECCTALEGAGGRTVLSDGTGYWAICGNDANAILVAAAPELLAALEEIAEFTGDCQDDDPLSYVYAVARAAIKKAVGQ